MKSGEYIKSLGGYRTYIPQPLPPDCEFSPATQRKIEEAGYLLGRVETCQDLLPNVDLLVYSSLQKEAIASSTIEGTIASPDELVRYQASHHADRAAVREVANYRTALEWGFQQLSERDITVGFLCGLRERLLAGVRGEEDAGRLKQRQNAIGRHPQDTIENALFIPCPPERVSELMEELAQYLRQSNMESKIVQCAFVHYQFETIHPFGDGNGRVGRLLIVLHMIKMGLLSAPMIYPSVFFEQTREQYCSRLQAVRDEDDWENWVAYFAQATARACQDTLAFTRAIIELRRRLRAQVADVRRRASYGEVLDVFFNQPVLSVKQICDTTRMSHKTVQTALDELIERKLVYEVTQREKGRMYACAPLLEAIFKPYTPT